MPLKTLSDWAETLLDVPRTSKRIGVILFDTLLCFLSVQLAFFLRLDAWIDPFGEGWQSGMAFLVAWPLAIFIFLRHGFYRVLYAYSDLTAVSAISQAFLWYTLGYALIVTLIGVDRVPRSIGIIQPLLLYVLVGGSRVLTRQWLGGRYREKLKLMAAPKVLIYGAGNAGRQLAAAISASHDMRIVAFIDDNPNLAGRILAGLPIHSPDAMADLVKAEGIATVLLALPSINRHRRNDILDRLRGLHVSVRTLPVLSEIVHGRVGREDLRELDIDDLLGREPVAPDEALMDRNIRGKVVLVTGAGGSIGSELSRQILSRQPACLLLLDHSEHALYAIHQWVTDAQPECTVKVVPLLASVRDENRLREILTGWRPTTIYHAAAYKHVPLVEYNLAEGLLNNVWGTRNLALLAAEAGVSDFVLISTDKAVRPTNVMGASKRLAEMILQALAAEVGPTRFTMVRFGNVLNSSGSVVPKFREQIRAGGPVTLTHPEITRYFMTVPEAAQLVIQAGAMARGGDVFLLDMGQPVPIIDLARRMIELSGRTLRDASHPDGDIEIQISGLRPGEKLYEELLIGDNPTPTVHPRIMQGHETFLPWSILDARLSMLSSLLRIGELERVRELLEHLTGYTPNSEIADCLHLEQTNN